MFGERRYGRLFGIVAAVIVGCGGTTASSRIRVQPVREAPGVWDQRKSGDGRWRKRDP